MVLGLNIDGLPIQKKVATPGRLKFLGDLHEALAVLSQGINPLEHLIGAHMKLTAHSPVGSLPIEVKMSGTHDEAARCSSLLAGLTESLLAISAPPAPNLACPQPVGGPNFEPVEAISLSR